MSMNIEIIEQHEANLRRAQDGSLKSNFVASSGLNASNGRARENHIKTLGREANKLDKAGESVAAERYRIQETYERAYAAEARYGNAGDMDRAQQAKTEIAMAQIDLARLDVENRTAHEKSAEQRQSEFAKVIDERKAYESQLATEKQAAQDKIVESQRINARNEDFKKQIDPTDQDRYESLMNDLRGRFADTNGVKDRDDYQMTDREHKMAHEAIVGQEYGQSESVRIKETHEAASERTQQDLRAQLDLKKLDEMSAANKLHNPLRNQESSSLQPENDPTQGRIPTESIAMREAGYVAEVKPDYIEYKRAGSEKAAVTDDGKTIKAVVSEMQDAEARTAVVKMVAEKFPDGYNIRCEDEQRKLEYAREAVRQGHGDKVQNPELKEFIRDFQKEHQAEVDKQSLTPMQQYQPKHKEKEIQLAGEGAYQVYPGLGQSPLEGMSRPAVEAREQSYDSRQAEEDGMPEREPYQTINRDKDQIVLDTSDQPEIQLGPETNEPVETESQKPAESEINSEKPVHKEAIWDLYGEMLVTESESAKESANQMPDFSHLPDDVAENARECWLETQQLAAEQAESQQETQSHSMTHSFGY